MRAILIVALTCGGCMTDFNGDTCVWAPGSDGDCPGDDEPPPPEYHRYLSATGAVVGDTLRVVVTASETSSGLTAETTTLPLLAEDPPDTPTAVRLDGEPLRAGARLAATGAHAYLVWTDGDDQHGAPLGDDGTLDGAQVIDFEGEHATVTAVGDRFLVVVDGAGFLGGEWIDVAGARVGAFVVAERDTEYPQVAIGDTPAGPAVAFGYLRRGALVVSRLGGAAIEIAGTTSTPFALAIAPDGGVLVVYSQFPAVRVARIDPGTGEVDDALSTLATVPWLVRAGDRLLAFELSGSSSLSARVLDDRGVVVDGPVFAGEADYGAVSFAARPGGLAMVAERDSAVVASWLDERGEPVADPVKVAEDYQLGCSAGGAGGPAALLAVLLLTAARRRRSRYPS